MAIRMIVAMLVGTVLAFGWGAASWTSGLYDFAFRPFPGDTGAAIAAQVASSADRDGAFLYPSPPSAEGMTEQQAQLAQDAFLAEHRKGPLVMAIVRREGVDPMGPTVLAKGFAIEFFCTAMLAAIVGIAAKFGARTPDRLALALLVPLFAVLATHGVLWNFFHLPDSYALALFIDGLVGWTLAAVPCALIIKPTRS
jgi:hypothetical protein